VVLVLTTPKVPGGAMPLVFSLTGILLVGALDYMTGIEIRVYALYFVPLCFGAWYGTARTAAVLTVLCAFTWTLSNHLSGVHYASPWAWPLNIGFNGVGFGVVSYLVARLRTSLGKERVLSRTDPLTSLWNGRVFREKVQEEIVRQGRMRRPFVLAYLDVDGFKRINDLHGHSGGDLALRRISAALRADSRSTDTAARLGGDEFGLLLPETDLEEGGSVLERVHEKLTEALAGFGQDPGMSMGAAVFETPPADVEQAVMLADSLMYESKRSGRHNLVIRRVSDTSTAPDGRGETAADRRGAPVP